VADGAFAQTVPHDIRRDFEDVGLEKIDVVQRVAVAQADKDLLDQVVDIVVFSDAFFEVVDQRSPKAPIELIDQRLADLFGYRWFFSSGGHITRMRQGWAGDKTRYRTLDQLFQADRYADTCSALLAGLTNFWRAFEFNKGALLRHGTQDEPLEAYNRLAP
jgi:hypothetical protein